MVVFEKKNLVVLWTEDSDWTGSKIILIDNLYKTYKTSFGTVRLKKKGF